MFERLRVLRARGFIGAVLLGVFNAYLPRRAETVPTSQKRPLSVHPLTTARAQGCFCGLNKFLRLRLWKVVPFRDMAAAADTVFGEDYRHPDSTRKAAIRDFVRHLFASNTEALNKKTNTDREMVAEFYTPELLERTQTTYRSDYSLFEQYF
ncbi:unnamed protein product [Phaeothamnion confervicola]